MSMRDDCNKTMTKSHAQRNLYQGYVTPERSMNASYLRCTASMMLSMLLRTQKNVYAAFVKHIRDREKAGADA